MYVCVIYSSFISFSKRKRRVISRSISLAIFFLFLVSGVSFTLDTWNLVFYRMYTYLFGIADSLYRSAELTFCIFARDLFAILANKLAYEYESDE